MGNEYKLVFCDSTKSIEYLELIFLTSKYPPSIKFALRNIEYSIKYYSSHGLESINSHSEEITYHSSMYKGSEWKPAVLHLKSNKFDLNKYFSISHNIHDIIESDFPIPICRIIFNGHSLPHLKKKSNKHYFELATEIREFNNGIDLYLVRKSSFDKFPYLWPRYSLLFTISEIDYLFQGVMPNYPLFTSMNRGPLISLEAEEIQDDYIIIFKRVFSMSKDKNSICFYDNTHYLSQLYTTNLQLIDDISNQPLSPIQPAFLFDKDYQENLLGLSKYSDLFTFIEKSRFEKINLINSQFVFLLPIENNQIQT